MCCDEDNAEVSLSFAEFLSILQRPPFEPCDRELEFLTPEEYEAFFNEIIRLYQAKIVRYINHIVDDYSRATELTQEVFLNLYKARISFARSYIYRAAKNEAICELRRRKREYRALDAHHRGVRLDGNGRHKDSEPQDTQPLPDAALIARRREAALTRGVERLPQRFRLPLALYVEGKSYKEITQIMKTNEGTIKSRICRAKRFLRLKLRAYLCVLVTT